MKALEMNTAINAMLKPVVHIKVEQASSPYNIKVSVLEVDKPEIELGERDEDFSGATEGDR